MSMMDRLKVYAEKTAEKREVSAQLKELNEQLTILEEELLEEMTAEGLTQARVDTGAGSFTIFPKRQIWAGIEEGQKLLAVVALEDHGMRDLLTANLQSLSSWCREREERGEPVIPDYLEGLVKVTEKFTLSVRKAGNGK